jgi:hypothetical protein
LFAADVADRVSRCRTTAGLDMRRPPAGVGATDVPILLSHTPGRYQTQYFWSPMSPGKNQPCFMMGLTVSQMVRQTKSRPHRFAGAGRGANAWGSAPRHRTGRDRRESPAPQPPSPAPHSHRAKAAILGQSVLRRHEAFRECHVQRINIRSNIPSNTSKGGIYAMPSRKMQTCSLRRIQPNPLPNQLPAEAPANTPPDRAMQKSKGYPSTT